MDPTDSGQGQEEPPEESSNLSPSSRGRQRKKNPKYSDFETGQLAPEEETGKRRRSRQLSEGDEPPKKTPRKRRGRRKVTQQSPDGETEQGTEGGAPQQPDGEITTETPKKTPRARKTPGRKPAARKTPLKKAAEVEEVKTSAGLEEAKPADGVEKAAVDEDGGGGGVVKQLENGKPKQKRGRRRKKMEEEEPVPEADGDEARGAAAEPEEELQPGGRRRRSAAKAALKYLHNLAKEVFSPTSDERDTPQDEEQDGAKADTARRNRKGLKGRKGSKRRLVTACYSEPEDDDDFVPNAEEQREEEDEDEDEDEAEDEVVDLDFQDYKTTDYKRGRRTAAGSRTSYGGCKSTNGFPNSFMHPVSEAAEVTKKFREVYHSSWVFPEWLPSTRSWKPVPQSEVEDFLPQELQSAAFRVSRFGLSAEETPLQRLSRFGAVPAHEQRLDMVLFTGGPVWALEWCPTPDGAPASQYVAVASHRGMDDMHHVNKTYTGSALVQLWDVGRLNHHSSPDSQPVLSYGLAQDRGFIWQMKWCPSGGWEPPDSDRKAPLLPRLGLLAVASSTSVVTIYSLPHPGALLSSKQHVDSGKDNSPELPVYQAKGEVTLKLGSFRAPRNERSGQVLSMDWMPLKPHNVIIIGFYDGTVGLWDLSTTSVLLRVREPDRSLSLLPYCCFLAHDHAVRAVAFCQSSRFLVVTAGEDRFIKTWDLRKLYNPIFTLKRHLTNEIYWPLNAPGTLLAQENAYAASGSHGVHFFDITLNTLFAIPRSGTVWSISFSDWMNCVVTGDTLGEVILAMLPHISCMAQYVKRTIDRRLPVYLTSLVPHDTTGEEGGQETVAVEEEAERQAAEQDEGAAEGSEAAPEGGAGENDNVKTQRGRTFPPLRFQTYKEAARKYSLHHEDNNMLNFVGYDRRSSWKHMQKTELKAKLNLDEMPLAALHKVRFSPNMCSHSWLASGGQAGLVRLHCLKGLITSTAARLIKESQAQFSLLCASKDSHQPAQTVTQDL